MAKSYPQYQMYVNGAQEWHSLHSAGARYDCGFLPVRIGDLVIETPDATPRPMTDDDRRRIANAADDYSDSK